MSPAGPGAQLPRRAWVEQVMGLPVSVHVRGPRAADAATAAVVERVFAGLREADARFSTYRPDSEVSRLRAGVAGSPSPLLREVQELCERARQLTGGSFDARLPGGWDPSGLVKGWAVEREAAALRALEGQDWLVNAGGDVLLHAEGGRSWRVGIEDPADPSRVLRVLDVATGAVATSGTAHRGSHIVDPATGGPASSALRSATVIGPSLLWADVFATAAVVKGTGARPWLQGLAGYHGHVVEDADPAPLTS